MNNPNWQEDLSSNVDCICRPVVLNVCTAAPRCSGVRIKAAATIVQTWTCGVQRTSFGSCGCVLQTTRRSHKHTFVHKRDIPSVEQPLSLSGSRWPLGGVATVANRWVSLTARLELIAGSDGAIVALELWYRKLYAFPCLSFAWALTYLKST